VKTITGHNGSVNSVCSNDKNFISGSVDKKIKIWDFNGKLIQTLDGHSDAVFCVSADNEKIFSGSLDKNVMVWDIQKGKAIHKLEQHTDYVSDVQFQGNFAVSSSWDKTVKLWDLRSKQLCVGTLLGHTQSVNGIQFELQRLASCSADKTIKTWDLRQNTVINTITLQEELNCLSFSRNRLCTGTAEGKVFLFEDWWDSTSPTSLSLSPHKDSVTSVQLTEITLATAGMDGVVKLFHFGH